MTDDTPRHDADGTERTESEPTDLGEDSDSGDVDDGTRNAGTTGDGAEREGETEGDDGTERDDGDGLRHYVERAVLGVLFLFAVVAAFRFYFAASNAVSYWVAARYESAFQAAFNLVVLLIVGAGIVRQLRRMR